MPSDSIMISTQPLLCILKVGVCTYNLVPGALKFMGVLCAHFSRCSRVMVSYNRVLQCSPTVLAALVLEVFSPWGFFFKVFVLRVISSEANQPAMW